MQPSIDQFMITARAILKNSWFSGEVLTGKQEFTVRFDVENDCVTITDVPEEPFQSLLLHVRKLTMTGPESLHKISNKLKETAGPQDRVLLDLWKKCLQLSMIKDSFIAESQSGQRHVVTPYRAYHSFINGMYFHTGDESLTTLIHGTSPAPPSGEPSKFLLNFFRAAVCSFASAAVALHDYIENNNTFDQIRIFRPGRYEVMAFILQWKHPERITEQYNIFNDWIENNGDGETCRKNCRWS